VQESRGEKMRRVNSKQKAMNEVDAGWGGGERERERERSLLTIREREKSLLTVN
jgi:ribosomal protein L2